jgi:hypothetical protein
MPYNEEEIRKRTSVFGRLGDKFTSTDDRINLLVQLLQDAGIFDLKSQVAAISDFLATQTGGQMGTGETYTIRFQETLAALAGDKFSQTIPWDCINTSVCFHFPSGCNGLVDVVAGHSDKQIYPRSGYIALNDATPVFSTLESIAYNEPVWVEIRNGDSMHSHTITVLLTIQRRVK